MPRRWRLPLTVFVLAALAGVSCSDLDVVTASYRTLAEARGAGAIDRGWVPDGLPAGTYELREAHDVDSNRRWGLFNFPQGQGDDLRALLEPGEISLAGVTCDIPARIEWWPVLVRGRLDHERITSAGLKAYRARSGGLLFLVNWEQGRAYYWSERRIAE